MPRTVQRKHTVKYREQPPKDEKHWYTVCGWCTTGHHYASEDSPGCMGQRSPKILCSCTRCYGPTEANREANTRRK